MPFKKTYRKRSKRSGSKVSKVTKDYVKKTINSMAETKNLNIFLDGDPVDTSGVVYPITGLLQQGANIFNRIADKIHLMKFTFRYTVHAADPSVFVSTDTYNQIRVIFFRWRDTILTTAVPAPIDILEDDSSVLTSGIYSLYNQDNIDQGRLHVIYDRLHTLGNYVYSDGTAEYTYNSDVSLQTVSKTMFGKKLGKKNLHYGKSTFPTLDDEQTDGLYMLVISDSQVAPNPYIFFHGRFFFTDI